MALRVARYERGRQSRRSHLYRKVVSLEVVGEQLHGALLFEADLRMSRDVVAECKQIRIHQLLRSRHDLIPGRVRTGQPRNQCRELERAQAPCTGCAADRSERGPG